MRRRSLSSFLRRQESRNAGGLHDYPGQPKPQPKPRISLFYRSVAILMAAIFLIGIDSVEVLADGSTLYSQLLLSDWADEGTITYDYDANGAMIVKTETGKEQLGYRYNLQGRLESVYETNDTPEDPCDDTILTTYLYNDAGIWVQKIENPGQSTETTTYYLVDMSNHTGYAQVLEEETWDTSDPNPANHTLDKRITYTIGDDVIAQSNCWWDTQEEEWVTAPTQYLLYDGHGSTRQLAEYSTTVTGSVDITDCYSYDAYGVMLGGNPTPSNPAATNLLYTGEMYDSNMDSYYLRARWYNQNNGRFNRMDPYAGNYSDPQSLHKYLYAHANPVNNIDPSGMGIIGSISSLMANIACRVLTFLIVGSPIVATAIAITIAVIKVCTVLFVISVATLIMMDLGVIPTNEYVADIVSTFAHVNFALILIAMMLLQLLYMLPSGGTSTNTSQRGTNNPKVKKAVEIGNRVHYDKTTDPTKYTHKGGPTQLQEKYPNTQFQFARRGQKGVDVTYVRGPHPSSYQNSKWPSGINQADFKPDTPSGNTTTLPPKTLRITYNPETGKINH